MRGKITIIFSEVSHKDAPQEVTAESTPWTQSLHILRTALKALWQRAFKAPYLALMLIREELSRSNTLTMKFTWMVQECLHYVLIFFQREKSWPNRSYKKYSVPTITYHNLYLTPSLNASSWPNNQQLLCGLYFISYFPINTVYTIRAGN